MEPHATVAEIMNPKLLYIREGAPLSLVRPQILKFGVTAVVVLDDAHRPVGIVSLRDLDVVDEDRSHISSPVVTLRANQSVDEGARILASTDLHHLVVVDEGGIAVGIVSAVDFVRALTGSAPRHPPAFARF